MGRFLIIITFFLLSAGISFIAHANSSEQENIRNVCEIQERLSLLGIDAGPIDGKVGKNTRQAVGAFLSTIKAIDKEYSGKEILLLLRGYEPTNSSQPKTSATRPANGKIFFDSHGHSIAPLKIKTAKQGYDYYIKLSMVDTGATVKTVYVRSGSSIKTQMPLGNSHLKYATGTQWFGKNCLFGMSTLFNKADRVFKFERVGDRVNGYTVELILQQDGNLATKKIRPEEW